MRKLLLYIILLITGLVAFSAVDSDELPEVDAPEPSTPDSGLIQADSDFVSTIRTLPDTFTPLTVDSVAADTSLPEVPDTFVPRLRPVLEKVDLDAPVEFRSSDSMIIVRRDSAYMFGKSTVTYGDLKLDAAKIELDLNTSTVYAVGAPDTTGEIQGKPVFNEKGGEYIAETMRYNFNTRKGLITNVVTEQGEGYLTGGVTKKDENDEYYIENGRYTTCDDHDCPHFYFNITRGKMRPGRDVVTGPVYMVLAGLPLPLAVPFGYFPFNDSYASGVIFPSFGDDYQKGFYLRDGGYYFAINDNIDLALRGELYTKGSWGINAMSTYSKRYKFSGNFQLSYLKTILGEKGSPDYSTQTNFQVIWSHSQDAKANPNMNLSASVNFTTSGYSRNDLNSYYSSAFTENTKSSSVNLTYRFPNSKWSLSTTMNVSQRTQDSTLAVSFPNFTLTMSQLAPFKRKKASGNERWYEKIRLSYSGQFQNSLTARQDVFFKKSLIKDWRNGMRHSVPISATFNLMKYINVTPSVNFTDRMYTSRVRRHWDPELQREIADTTYSLYNVYDFQASLSLDTKVYGFWRPVGFLAKKVSMIRHVMTPSISLNGAPDFGSPFFGYYDSYDYTDQQGNPQTRIYSLFPNALFGVPSQGKNGSVSFSLSNNLEMKVKSQNDSIAEKKISLIENLTIGESYNFAVDSLNWSDINTSILLRLTKGFNLNLGATWDVYTYQLNQYGNPVRVNVPRWKVGKGLGRLRSTGTSFSYTFNNDTFKRKNKDKDSKSSSRDHNSEPANPADLDNPDTGDDYGSESSGLTADGYVPWQVPWSLTMNYSIAYSYGNFNKQKLEYDSKITQNLSLSGSIRPTKNWNFSFTASFDFNTKRLAYMNCNITRDLHCFSMRASFVPVGPYKSYTFNIAVKSSMLSDLKYDKRSSVANGVDWY